MSVQYPQNWFFDHDESEEVERPCGICGEPDGDVCSCYDYGFDETDES